MSEDQVDFFEWVERNADGHRPAPRPVLVSLADVAPERIEWLWPGYLAKGKLHVIDGDPGLGKSTIGFDLAARITTGSPWPDGASGVKSGAVVMSAEDGLGDTIRPRLDAHGADVSRMVALTAVRDTNPETGEATDRLPDLSDLGMIRQAIERADAALLLIDPLSAYLPSHTDAMKDADIRRLLAPLAQLAEQLGVAVVIVRHLRKSGGKAIYAGGGSIGIIGAARVGFVVAQHPDEDGRCVFAISKVNIAAKAPTLAYRLTPDEEHGCGRIKWEGPVDMSADDLTADASVADQKSDRAEAAEWLTGYLTDAGGSAPAPDAMKAGKDAGFSEDVIKKARRKVAESKRSGFGKGASYAWVLPCVPWVPGTEPGTHGTHGGTHGGAAPMEPATDSDADARRATRSGWGTCQCGHRYFVGSGSTCPVCGHVPAGADR